MGILTDLFVADPEHAITYVEDPQLRHFERFQSKGLLDLNFSILWAQLQDQEWNNDLHALDEVWMSENGEEWLFRFPSPLVELLTQLTPSSIGPTAARWAQTEELDCPPSDVEPVLQELGRLARMALENKHGLYLWGSL